MLTQTRIRADAIRRPAPAARCAPPVAIQRMDGSSKHTPLDQSMHLAGATMSYPRNTEIFGESEPAEYLYKVVHGCVRTYKILSDGRRQIGGFYLPGDILDLNSRTSTHFRRRPSPTRRCW
jgi:CRP/FNR family nitrogen fixation transcriptional regulator